MSILANMQQNKAIIVCSVYQSETSETIVRLIRDLCPSQKVIFQPLEKTTQFDGRKVVFCHSSFSGRLALTDVNDSIYDKAVKDASRAVGKENVAFVVTDVEAADIYLRRKMITQTQHTLVSETNLLLLVGKVDEIDGEVLNQFKEFLMMIRLHEPPKSPPVNQPPYYDLLKYLPQFAIVVIIIACFVSVNSRLDIFKSHINVLRNESFDKIHHLEKTLNSTQRTVSAEEAKLETSLKKKMDDIKEQLQNEFGTKMKDMQSSLTGNMEDHRSKLTALALNITNIQSDMQSTITETCVRNKEYQDSQYSELINITKVIQDTLQSSIHHSSQFQTELNRTIHDMQKRIGQCLELQTVLEKEISQVKSALQKDLEELRSNLPTDLLKATAGYKESQKRMED